MPPIRLALAGDVIATRDLVSEADEGVLEIAHVLRGADCAIANLELPLHDFTSPAAVAPGGIWLGAHPQRAHDLAWLGLSMVSRANNHAGDYGPEAMRQTDIALASAGIAHAGSGPDLRTARAPQYVDTSAGRVALISATTTFPLVSMAGDARPPIPGRPGISPLRRAGDRLVEPAEALARVGLPLADLRTLGTRLPPWMTQAHEDTSPICTPDADAVLAAVEGARDQADAVVVALHSHDQGATAAEASAVLRSFARDCIDAGADAVAGHGAHVVRGVEMYRDRPILHGLGSLFFQPDTVPYLPEEAYRLYGLGPGATVADVWSERWADGSRGLAALPSTWRGLIAVVTLHDGPAEVEMIPLDLRQEAGPGRWGTPRVTASRSG